MADEKFELISYDGKSVMGISKGDSVFIDFTKMRKNQGFVELMGKQGTKKTSTLLGIAYNMGCQLELDKKRLFNSIDNDLGEKIVGKKNGTEYEIEVNASRLVVRKKIGDKFKPADEDTPAELVKKLFGPVGLFPDIKALKGRQQIEFFQTYGSGSDGSKKMQKLETDYDTKFADRRDINRDVALLKGALEVEPLYQNYEGSQKKFAISINAEGAKRAFDDKSKKNADYERYKTNLELLKVGQQETQKQIDSLKQQLIEAEKQEKDTAERIKNGDKWMKDHENDPREFETANKEWLNLSKTMTDYAKWQDILKKEKQLTEKQEQSVTLTGELDELNEKILKATNDCLPKVKGLTAKVATGIDKKDKPEGMFYLVPGKKQEQPLHELSETENADMWCEIWDEQGSQFIFIENMTSFGDSMVKTLNRFVENGGIVFYTLQNRKQKDLSITFKSKID